MEKLEKLSIADLKALCDETWEVASEYRNMSQTQENQIGFEKYNSLYFRAKSVLIMKINEYLD